VNVAEEVANLSDNQDGNGHDEGSTSLMEDMQSETQRGTSENAPLPEPFRDGSGNDSTGSGKGGDTRGRS
jgi:hypothetical protein